MPDNLKQRQATDRAIFETLRQSEFKLSKAGKIAHLGYWEYDLTNHQFSSSAEAYRVCGQKAETTSVPSDIASFFKDIVVPEDWERFREVFYSSLRGDGNYDIEYRIKTEDGQIRYVHSRGEVEYDEGGSPMRLFGIVQDITRQKQVEELLRSRELEFRSLAENSADEITRYNTNCQLVYANAAVHNLLAVDLVLLGLTPTEALPGVEAFERLQQHLRKSIETATIIDFELVLNPLMQADDSVSSEIKYRLCRAVPEFGADGRVTGAVVISRDIGALKQAELERQQSLEFFEGMDRLNKALQHADSLEKAMQGALATVLEIFACDRAYLAFPLDPLAEHCRVPIFCTSPGFPSCVDSEQLLPVTPGMAAEFKLQLETAGPLQFNSTTGYHKFDRDKFLSHQVRSELAIALHPKTGKPWRFGIHQCSHERIWTEREEKIFHEISRRLSDGLTSMLALQELRKNEKLLDDIVNNLPSMVFVKEPEDLKFVMLNRTGEKMLGCTRECFLGKTDYDFFPKDVADYFTAKDREALQSKEPVDIPQEVIRTCNDEKRYLHTRKVAILDEAGKAQYLLGISEDVTEHLKLEAQLRQSQKMDAVGQLAGGVAHDFNNMLGVIIGYADLAMKRMARQDPAFSCLKEIRSAADRSADLTRQLLAFARKQAAVPKVLDLNETAEGMLKMLMRLIGEDIELEWLPGPGGWLVKIDPSQVDQILANLCVNCRDAINGAGKISIETGRVSLDEHACSLQPGSTPGDFVMLQVSDTGCGMSRQTLERIFEPFFSTKESGKGTGLGLAMVYGIVKQNSGFVNVYSEPGIGTTVKIHLPRHMAGGPPEKKEKARQIEEGSETILLVEDEPAILYVAKEMLESLGYRIIVAAAPEEGIEIAARHPGKIDLLITDMIMPGMNGRELAGRITLLYPDIRCLFMSGYTNDSLARHGGLDDDAYFIQKPFSIQKLAGKIRDVLA